MTATFDPTAPLTATGNLRRRQAISRLASGGAVAAALLALAVLGIVLSSVARRGAGVLNFDFLTKSPPLFGGPGGGIAPELVGTGMIVALATVIAMPVGVLVALYVTEFAGARSAHVISATLNLMQGLPTIVVGVFVFGLIVAGHPQSGVAGSVALAIIMLPLIARSTQEVILLVPGTLREAAQALGVGRWRTVRGVILPAAASGILTGTILAVARGAGETAPLILLSSIFNPNQVALNPFGHALPNIPVYIFTLSEQADPSSFSRAWGAAFVLLALILIANLAARTLLARSHRRHGL